MAVCVDCALGLCRMTLADWHTGSRLAPDSEAVRKYV